MRLQRLSLRDFRNFEQCGLEFAPRFTVLFGHNGAGKTNVLEAIYLVSTLRSFRTSDQGAMVRHGQPAAQVELVADDPVAGLPTTLEVRLERREKSTRRVATADGKVVRSGAAFYGRISAVLFTPEDLAILRGSPSGRRQFVDRMLFARERAHIGDIQSYEKLLRSRNHVLKREDLPAGERDDLLDTYEAGLAQVGARVWTRRVRLLEELLEPFAATFEGIHGQLGPDPGGSGATAVGSVRYAAKLGEVEAAEREATLRDALRQRRPDDLRRRMTTVGPHRDDIEVTLDGQPAGDFASQGQARALVLGLKLAELTAARRATGAPPLLLLDDVSSELDPKRSAMLFRTLAQDAGQCILTTTSPDFIDLPGGAQSLEYRVDRGRVEPAETAVSAAP
jgi:DNA replication and repair protein RecF